MYLLYVDLNTGGIGNLFLVHIVGNILPPDLTYLAAYLDYNLLRP